VGIAEIDVIARNRRDRDAPMPAITRSLRCLGFEIASAVKAYDSGWKGGGRRSLAVRKPLPREHPLIRIANQDNIAIVRPAHIG